MRKAITLITTIACACATSVSAQETRAEIAERERAEKSKQLKPYTPGKVEKGLFYVEDNFLVQRVFNPPRGVFLRFGGLPEGSSMGAAPAYRYSTHDWSLTATSVISVRRSREIDVRLSFPPVKPVPTRGIFSVGAQHQVLPAEDFWVVGNNTPTQLRSTYSIRTDSADVTGSVDVTDWFQVGGSAEYLTPSLDD